MWPFSNFIPLTNAPFFSFAASKYKIFHRKCYRSSSWECRTAAEGFCMGIWQGLRNVALFYSLYNIFCGYDNLLLSKFCRGIFITGWTFLITLILSLRVTLNQGKICSSKIIFLMWTPHFLGKQSFKFFEYQE